MSNGDSARCTSKSWKQLGVALYQPPEEVNQAHHLSASSGVGHTSHPVPLTPLFFHSCIGSQTWRELHYARKGNLSTYAVAREQRETTNL